MFILDGKSLPLDTPFEHNDIQYPANWLRLSTPEEKAAIGITWQNPPAPYDERFYWGWTENNELIPKDHDQLVTLWISNTKTTAGTLLAPTDWMVIRELDNGTIVPVEIKNRRQEIRNLSTQKCASIKTTKTTEELAGYVTSSAYSSWESPVSEQILKTESIIDFGSADVVFKA